MIDANTRPVMAPPKAMLPARHAMNASGMLTIAPVSTSIANASIGPIQFNCDRNQRTPPAAAGTDTLSSIPIGSVSTSPARNAAATGAHIVKTRLGGGCKDGATHQDSATAPAAPATTNAINPLQV